MAFFSFIKGLLFTMAAAAVFAGVTVSAYALPGDADGDGIADVLDTDDDNDGVPDAVESPSMFYNAGEANKIVAVTSALTSTNSFALLIDGSSTATFKFNAGQAMAGAEIFKLEYPVAVPLTSVTIENVLSLGTSSTGKLQGSTNGSSWVELSTTNVSLATTANKVFPVQQNAGAYKFYRIVGVATASTLANAISEITSAIDTALYNPSLNPKAPSDPTYKVNDLDGDGIANHLDTDSDGDGCLDAVEGGAVTAGSKSTYSAATGKFNGPFGTNGLADAVETSADSGAINYNSTYIAYAISANVNLCNDMDGDGIPDLLDPDIDGDCISNWAEGYAPTGDARALAQYKDRLMRASFHSAFYQGNDGGYFLAGDDIDSSGASPFTTPRQLSPANGFNFTGKIIDVAAVGSQQHVLLTTDGMWCWGWPDQALSWQLTGGSSSTSPTRVAFRKVALPSGLNPANADSMTSTRGGTAVLMKDGTVWAAANAATDISILGAGPVSPRPTGFVPVRLNATTPLTGITDMIITGSGGFAYSALNNTFYTWGLETYLGNGTAKAKRDYATSMVNPLPPGVKPVQIVAVVSTYLVLGTDGRVYSLGDWPGTGVSTASTSWTFVRNEDNTAPITGVTYIDGASSYNTPAFSMLVDTPTQKGRLLSWGIDGANMLAIGGTTYYLPKQPTGAVVGREVFAVENGGHFTPVIFAGDCGGTIANTGHNPGGAFGDGTTTDRSTYTAFTFLGDLVSTCSFDADGDGVPNYLDLDSDDDGCSDQTEAGNCSIADYNRFALTPSFNLCLDSDGDGIADFNDIDDDNDGVPDHIESPGCFYTSAELNGSAKSQFAVITSQLGAGLSFFRGLTDGDGSAGAVQFTTSPAQDQNGKEIFRIQLLQPTRLDAIHIQKTSAFQVQGGNVMLQGSNDGTTWTDLWSAPANPPNLTTATTASGQALTNANTFTVQQNAAPYRFYRILGVATANIGTGGVTEFYFDINTAAFISSLYPKPSCSNDLDGDGVPNHLDTDSDGDGCSDAFESGSTTNRSQSVIAGPYGDNGLANSVENPTSDLVFQTVTKEDFGFVGIPPTITSTNNYTAALNVGGGTGDGNRLANDAQRVPGYTWGWLDGTRFVDDGQYAILSNPRLAGYLAFVNETRDNTTKYSGGGGGMLFVNGSNPGQVAYAQTVTNLNVGKTYQLSAWVTSVVFSTTQTLNQSNLLFRIKDANGTVIASNSTGNIPNLATLDWRNYTLNFTASTASVTFELVSNGIAGGGNDFALDDIELREGFPAESGTINYGSSYNLLATIPARSACSDTDGDGFPDYADADADNDGVLNMTEAPSCFFTANEWNTANKSDMVLVSSDLNTAGGFGNFAALANGVGSTNGAVQFATNQSALNKSYLTFTFLNPVRLDALVLGKTSATQVNGANLVLQGANSLTNWVNLAPGTNVANATSVTMSNGAVVVSNANRYAVTTNAATYRYYRLFSTNTNAPSAGTLSEIYFDVNTNSYVTSIFGRATCGEDTDGDGIPNYLDLDSDNDGSGDAYEAGASTNKLPTYAFPTNSVNIYGVPTSVQTNANSDTVTYASTYSNYATNAALNLGLDSDNDGVRDLDDLDDDNDGITDCEEGFSGGFDFSSNSVTGSVATGITNRAVEPSGFIKFSYTAVTTNNQFAAPMGDAFGNLGMSTKTGSNNLTSYRLNFTKPAEFVVRNNLGPGFAGFVTGDEYQIFTANGGGITLNDPANELEIWNGTAYVSVPANYRADTIRWRLRTSVGNSLPIGAGSFTFDVSQATSFQWTQVNQASVDNGVTLNFSAKCLDIDTDGDGIPNRLDPDSDGDNCPDAFESGTSTNSFTNTVAGPYGADGWADSIQTNPVTAFTNITFTIATNNIALATDGGTTATTNAYGGSMSGNIMSGTNVAGQWFLSNFRYTRKAIGPTRILTGTNFTATNTNNPYGVAGIAMDMNMGGSEGDGVMKYSYQVSVAMNPGYRADKLLFLGNGVFMNRNYGPAVASTNTGGAIRLNGFIGDNTGTVFDPSPPDALVAADGQTFSQGTNLQGYKGDEKGSPKTKWYFSTPAALPVTYSVDMLDEKSMSSELTAFSVRVVADNYATRALNENTSPCSFPTASITSVTVNEASPYAIVKLALSEATQGPITLTPTLLNGTGYVGIDTGTTIEYYNGTAWVSAASGVTIPAGQTSVLLRVAITPDSFYEVSETVQISTGPLSGPIVPAGGLVSTVTIKDDGTGDLFSSTNTNGTPNAPGTSGLPATLDNDASALTADVDTDGINNLIDIDDDNDGITDCEEGFSGAFDFTGVANGISSRSLEPTGYIKFSVAPVTTANQFAPPTGDALGNFGMATVVGAGQQTSYRMTFTKPVDFLVRNQLGPNDKFFLTGDEYEIFTANGAGISLSDPANELEIWNGTAWVAVPANHTATTIQWRLRGGAANFLPTGSGSFQFTVLQATWFQWTQVNTSTTANNGVTLNFSAQCADIDTDGDGIPNRLDLDSDGDGCSDAFEAGTYTTGSIVPGPYGDDGWADSIQTNTVPALTNVTYTITNNAITNATAGTNSLTTLSAFGGSMSGQIMAGTNVAGQWFVSNFRYTKKAISTTNTITATNFVDDGAGTANPYPWGGVGVNMFVGTETSGIMAFSYQVRVAMNPGYRAEKIHFLGKNPASTVYYGPGLPTNSGGSIRINGFTGTNTGTLFDPNDNLVATNGQTFSAGTDLLGYKGAEKTDLQTTWYASVPATQPATLSVNFAGQPASAANEATAFSVKVVADAYAAAVDPLVNNCPPLPNAPTVNALVTNVTTPTLTGTVALNPGDTLSVVVNGVTYTTANGLVINGGTWSLPLPTTPEGSYSVTATVTNSAGVTATDVSADELTIDTTPPATPTVNAQTTSDLLPVITGTAIVAPGETLRVTVNGATFVVVPDATGNWSLPTATAKPVSGTLAAFVDGQTYPVTAKVTDPAGNTATDTTTNELTISSSLPSTPTVIAQVTNNPTPTVTGTAVLKEGQTLAVTINDVTYTSENGLTINGSIWSVTLPATPEGIYPVTATVTGEGGVTATDTTTNELIIDLTPPATPTVIPQITNNPTPTVTGTVTLGAGETLAVTINGVTYTTANGLTINGTTWSVTLPTTPEGTYPVTATVMDAAGNTATDITTNELAIDLTLPAAATVVPQITNDTTPTVTGTVTLGDGETLSVTINGVTYTTANGLTIVGTTWSVTLPETPEGTYPVTATVTDAAGNAVSDTTSNELIIDLTPPAAPTVVSQITNDTTPTLTGTVTLGDGETLAVTINGVTYTTANGLTIVGTTWSVTLPETADGTYPVTATVTDAAGNSTSDATTDELIIDTVKPEPGITVNSITTDDIINIAESGQTIPITGTTTGTKEGDTVTLTINGKTFTGTVTASGNYSINVPGADLAADSDKTVAASVSTTDAAGNTGTGTANKLYAIDLVAPTPTVTVNNVTTDNILNAAEAGQTIPITGTTTGTQAGDIVTLTINGKTFTGTVAADLTYSIEVPGADLAADADTKIDASVSSTDEAGNTGTGTAQKPYTVDTTPPVLTVTSVGEDTGASNTDRITRDNTLTLTGKTEPGAKVDIYDGGTKIGTVTAGPDGVFTFTTAPLADGPHDFTVTATDAAGNTTDPVSAGTWTVDTAVAITITSIAGNAVDPTNPTGIYDAIERGEDPAQASTLVVVAGTTDAEPGQTVVLTLNGKNYTALVQEGGTWSVTLSNEDSLALNHGSTYPIIASVEDLAGNTATTTGGVFALTVNIALPDVPIVDNLKTTSTTPTVGGTAKKVNPTDLDAYIPLEVGDTMEITLNGLSVTATITETGTNVPGVGYDAATGRWTLDTATAGSFNLADGTYDIAISVSSAGFTKRDISTGELVINSTPPEITINVIAGDDLINAVEKNQSLTLGGTTTAEVGAIVTLTGPHGINYTATVLAGLNGAPNYYTVTVPSTVVAAFTDGDKTLTASVTNEFGLTGTATRDYTVDATPPTAPVITFAKDDVGTITKDVLDGGVTDDTLPVLVITGDPGVVMKVYSGGQLLGTATEDPQNPGTYALQLTTPLAEGPHAFVAVATDKAGNSSPLSAPFGLTVDTTPPKPTIFIDSVTPDNVVNIAESQGKVTITGTTTGTKVGDTVTLTINGKTFTGTVDANGKFNIEVNGSDLAADGGIGGLVTTTDEAGNIGTAVGSQPYLVDIEAPKPGITVNSVTADNILNAAEAGETITITGTTTGTKAGDIVMLKINGVSYTGTVAADLTYSIEVAGSDLAADPDATIDASVSTTDEAGNTGTGTAQKPYTVDTTPPAAPTVVSQITNNKTPTVIGTVTLGDGETLSVTINGTTYTTANGLTINGTTWSVTLPETVDGTYEVTATVTDAAGNSTSDSTTDELTIDTVAPQPGITVDSVTADNILNAAEADQTIPITGTTTGTKEGDTVTLTINGKTFTGTVDANGNYSINVSGADLAADTMIAASVSTSDEAGNIGTGTAQKPYAVDTVAPTPTITINNVTADNILNAAEAERTITITGTTTGTNVGDTVTLMINGQTFTGLVAADGTYSIDVPGSVLAEDTKIDASVSTTDEAGNTGTGTAQKPYTVDVDPPVPTIMLDSVTADNILSASEAADVVLITGTTTGTREGDIVTLVINGRTFSGPVDALGKFSIEVPGTDLEADEDRTIDASVVATDLAGNTGSATTTKKYGVAGLLAVNNPNVNEISPFVVFAVTGTPEQVVTLALKDGTATGDDYGPTFEYFDGTKWKAYTAGTALPLDENGELFVRVAIVNDAISEGAQDFTLTVTSTGTEPVVGTATIYDNATGDYWIGDTTVPATAEELAAAKIALDDDRPLQIGSIQVNEGSRFGVFNVISALVNPSDAAGQLVSLTLTPGTATTDDYVPAFEYFDGVSWQTYTAGDLVPLDENGQLFVRVAIVNDDIVEGAHSFTLMAGGTGGTPATGTATIYDNGTGDYWIDDARVPATIEELAAAKIVLDDDRCLAINSIIVNEVSPFGIFQVTGAPGQLASLVLGAAGDTATTADYGAGLEVFVDGKWVAYSPGQFVELDGTGLLLVRVPITADNNFETSEKFTLAASNTGGASVAGSCEIRDDGKGTLFGPNNTTGLPDKAGESGLPANLILDDDRRPFAKLDFIEPLPDRPLKFLPSVLLGNDVGNNLKLVYGKWTTALGGTVEITARAVTYTPPALGGLAPDDIDSFNYTVYNEFGQDVGQVNLIAKERALTLPIKIISAETMVPAGKMVRLCAIPMMRYEVFATSNLATNTGSVLPENGIGSGWELVGVFTANGRGDIYVNDINAGAQRFYRLRIRP